MLPVLFCCRVRRLRPRSGREIIEQVLVKVNGDIITKTEFEQRQVAELRNRPELANVSPDQPGAAQGDRRNHAGADPRRRRRAAADPARPRAGLALGDEQFNSILDNIKKQNNLEDERSSRRR